MKLLELYVCGCYSDGACMLTREIAECDHYDKCMSGGSPLKLVSEEMDNGDWVEYITDNI